MIKIFIPQYIVFIEDVEFLYYLDTYIYGLNIVQGNPFGWINQPVYIQSFNHPAINYIFINRPIWQHPNLSHNSIMFSFITWWIHTSIMKVLWVKNNEFDMLYHLYDFMQYFSLNLKTSITIPNFIDSEWWFITHFWLFDNYSNHLLLDFYLYYDSIYNIWNLKEIYEQDQILRSIYCVFYRPKVYLNEWIFKFIYYYCRPSLPLVYLNPIYEWLVYGDDSHDMLFIRQWVILIYMTYDNDVFFPEEAVWLTNYFNIMGYYSKYVHTNIYEFCNDNLFFILKLYVNFNIIYILFFCIIFIFRRTLLQLCSSFIIEPYIILGNLNYYSFSMIVVMRRIIRLRNIKNLKKYNVKVFRRSDVENYYFNFFTKYFLKKIIFSHYTYMFNYLKFFKFLQENFLSDPIKFKFKFYNFIISIIFLNFFIWIFLLMKTSIYNIYIFYYVILRKYLFFFKYVTFKNSFRFYTEILDVVHTRDVEWYNAFEIMKRLINYMGFHTKGDFKRKIKNEVIQAYDITMWSGFSEWDDKRDEYINYFYGKIFTGYFPDDEFFQIWYPRFLFKYYFNVDFSFNKIRIFDVTTVFNSVWTKFVLINVKKVIKMTFLRYFFYYRFWKVYFFYFYTMYHNKLDKFNNIFKIYLLYFYTLYMYIYFYFNNIYYFIFTEKRILIKYYFFIYLNIIDKYLINVNYFKYLYKYLKFFFGFIYMLLNYFYDLFYLIFYKNIYLNLLCKRLSDLSFYIFSSDRGYSYNFWYRYYFLKFYFIEYNIIFNIIIFIRNIILNITLFLIFFYTLSGLFFSFNFSSIDFVYFVTNLITIVYDFLKNGIFSFLLTSYSSDINWYHANYNTLFEYYVDFYHNNYAFYSYKFIRFFSEKVSLTSLPYREKDFIYIANMYIKTFSTGLRIGEFSIPQAVDMFSNTLASWLVLLDMHVYFIFRRKPHKIMMWDMYWIFMPTFFLFIWKLKLHIVYYYLLLPVYWIWQYFFSFIVYYSLWISSFIPPLYYIFFYFFKFLYNIYISICWILFYFYYYYYYYFWLILNNFLDYYFVFYELEELLKYDSIKFFIGLDIINFFKMILYSFILLIISIFNGIFFFFYKIAIFIVNIFGLNNFLNMDFYSFEYLSKFRSFAKDIYNCVLVTDYYDIDDFNSIFNEYAQRKAGGRKRRNIKFKIHRIKRDILITKLKTITFEYKIRGFLFADTNVLSNMIFYQNFFDFRAFYLFCFMFFSLYFQFFLVLFTFGFILYRSTHLFKDQRYLFNSATYEWKNFTKKNIMQFGYDDFYWLYNIRWLNSFEFYLDKYFQDDLYVNVFKKDKMVFGIYLYETLNEIFFFRNQTASQLVDYNRYFRFRRYYFDRYSKFIKDIDYIFTIFSISYKNIKKKTKLFLIYDFFLPFFRKKKNKFNYIYETDIIVDLNRLDYVWLYFVAPAFLSGRDWYDMTVFGQDLISKEFYFKMKKSLFKAYGLLEMNRKEVNIDLYEFQFFEKDFLNFLTENWGGYEISYKNLDNPVLRRLIYGRAQTVLLYTSYDKDEINGLYNTLDFEKFIGNFENYLIYLKNLNKNYFSNLIDFSLFTFVESISYTLTHLTPDIAKTAVDIEKGKLIGVSYKKSMLLDEFTSTEITEHVFDSVDKFLIKEDYKNMEMYRVLLREDTNAILRPLSSWWIILVIIPFFFLYLEFDFMFKYGRFILPNFALIEWMDYVSKQFFSLYDIESYLWSRTWWHDHINYSRKIKYQFKRAHVRTYVWNTRWIELQSFWSGEHMHLFQIKLDYAWFYIYKLNEKYFRLNRLDFFWDFYILDFFKYMKINMLFFLIDLISFIFFFIFIFLIISFIFFYSRLKTVFNKSKILNMKMFIDIFKTTDGMQIFQSFAKQDELLKRRKIIDFEERLKKHKRLSIFIYEYKKKEKELEEKKKEEEKKKFKF